MHAHTNTRATFGLPHTLAKKMVLAPSRVLHLGFPIRTGGWSTAGKALERAPVLDGGLIEAMLHIQSDHSQVDSEPGWGSWETPTEYVDCQVLSVRIQCAVLVWS